MGRQATWKAKIFLYRINQIILQYVQLTRWQLQFISRRYSNNVFQIYFYQPGNPKFVAGFVKKIWPVQMRTHLFCLFFGYHPISRGFICRFCGEVAKGRELPFSLMVGKEFGKAGPGQMQIFLMDSSCDTPAQGLI